MLGKLKKQKLIGGVLLLVGVALLCFLFLGNNYENQTDVIDRAIENLNKEEYVSNVDASVSYNGDGVYEIDMLFQFSYANAGEIGYFMQELGALDIKFKKIIFDVYNRVDEKGQRNYIFTDAEMTYRDYKKAR